MPDERYKFASDHDEEILKKTSQLLLESRNIVKSITSRRCTWLAEFEDGRCSESI
ncbi:hypothetical protein J6590_074398 [Homalodisca vitripennis]|nr:hypothetical protein J6590_074398 [Homalodisca vitripennis]